MEYKIEDNFGLWKQEFDEIENGFIETLSDKRLSIAEVQSIFNNIMWKLTVRMPISTDKIQ